MTGRWCRFSHVLQKSGLLRRFRQTLPRPFRAKSRNRLQALVSRLRSKRTEARLPLPQAGGGVLATARGPDDPFPAIPRRAPLPHFALRARGPDDQVAEGGSRISRVLPVPQREDAQFLRQRRQGFLSLLRLLGAWRCDPVDDGSARAPVHGCGEGACAGCGYGASRDGPARGGEGGGGEGPARSVCRRRRLVHRAVERHRGGGGADRARPARDQGGDGARVRARLCAGQPRQAEGCACRLWRSAAGRGRAADQGRGEGPIRPLSRAPDDPDPRPARPDDRVRRAYRGGRRAQISELARDPRSSTRGARSTISTRQRPLLAKPGG